MTGLLQRLRERKLGQWALAYLAATWVGFIELWDKYGAPDDCKRRALGEYVCE